MIKSRQIQINAVGDISFQGKSADNPSAHIFSSIIPDLKNANLTIANLENPLLEQGRPVPGKCTLRGSVGWAQILKETGIRVLSLANNHIMDYGEDGLFSTIKALESSGLYYVGAGRNKEQACSPIFLDLAGQNIAILSRTSVIVSSPSYAGKNQPGVAFLDIKETKRDIKNCKQETDIVILIIHWGVEEYKYPSPDQSRLAREFVEAGADLIIGHHPHVLQGIEKVSNGLVCYSLGNFIFDEFLWSFINKDGLHQENVFKLSPDNRKSGILKVYFNDTDIESYEIMPTLIQSNGTVQIDDTMERRDGLNRLCSRLNWPAYNLFWRFYSLKQEWHLRIKPLLRGIFSWQKIKKIRPKHFKQLSERLRRSSNITSGKSTNPYE